AFAFKARLCLAGTCCLNYTGHDLAGGRAQPADKFVHKRLRKIGIRTAMQLSNLYMIANSHRLRAQICSHYITPFATKCCVRIIPLFFIADQTTLCSPLTSKIYLAELVRIP